jgi:hypothetical protein
VLTFSLVIRRGGVKPNRSRLDVLPHVSWNILSRYLEMDDISKALLPAYPHLFENLKNNVPVSAVSHERLDVTREAMLASPTQVTKLTLDCRPPNKLHLKKLRTLLRSTSLVTLTVRDPTWLVGETMSTELNELQLEVPVNYANVDIWAMWCPASAVSNGIKSLSVTACSESAYLHGDDDPAPTYLSGGSTCFDVFHKLEKITFCPSPTDLFWCSASDLALSQLRELTLEEAHHADQHDDESVDHSCPRNFLKHAARFANLVTLNLVGSCDILGDMVEHGVVLRSLQVFTAERGYVPMSHETWARVPASFPLLCRLEMTQTHDEVLDDAVYKQVLANGFANLRIIKLRDYKMSLETCLEMAVAVLKRHPTGSVTIRCECISCDVSSTTAAFLDCLRLHPFCRVTTTPEVVSGFVGRCDFELRR